ncbi:UNVERIFIED_CONTAM: hypothetical protein HDU68_011068 [Siphonaria sp. JEL0065]|nr:hypothetical protein HDU68_011068 [Siphonaria sp. JEL0065]
MTPPPTASSSKRRAQVRAAQKTFTERRKIYVQQLEAKVALIESTNEPLKAALDKIAQLEDKVKQLELELELERALKSVPTTCPIKNLVLNVDWVPPVSTSTSTLPVIQESHDQFLYMNQMLPMHQPIASTIQEFS